MVKNAINYSLWLRPAQTQIDDFAKIISRLAHSYRTMPFPPHITLASGITTDSDSIKQACVSIIDQTQQIDLQLQNIAYTETYYRNFFVQAELTQALSKLHENTISALAHKTDEVFMPHLSLLYGYLEIETKKNIQKSLEKTCSKLLHCRRLDLYSTNGKVTDWFLVESYLLKSRI